MDKKLKKVFTSIKSRAEGVGGSSLLGGRHGGGKTSNGGGVTSINGVTAGDGTAEGTLLQAINAFCETGGPDNPNPGEEFLHLPTIVDIAESTPSAAAVAAAAIRKNLDLKTNAARPYIQYNSVMLLRILAQNPGYTFTRNTAEGKFATAVKEVLRNGRDPSVNQILCETLEYFLVDPERIADEGLNLLREVWTKHKGAAAGAPQPLVIAPMPGQPALPPRSAPQGVLLPEASELAARISEANTSAALLRQLVQSTPQAEIAGHELVKEFADRCKLASRSMQAFISADNPPADPDTLTTLIETNDTLGMAIDAYRKAVKAARASDARVVDVGEATEAYPVQPQTAAPPEQQQQQQPQEFVRPDMHGAASTQDRVPTTAGDLSPVSPLTPQTRQSETNSNVFRF